VGVSVPPAFALVAPYLPAPANTGGRIRIHRLALALSHHGPVDLYARFWPVELDPAAGDPTAALSVYRHRVLRGAGVSAGLLPGVHPLRAREAAPRALRHALHEAHARVPYRAVVVCHSYAAGVARGLRDVATVLDEHNVESRYAAALRPDDRAEAARLARWERACWRAARAVTCVSEGDASRIARWRPDVTVVPNGVAAREITFVAPSARAPRELLFVGAMSHAPNVAAAVELVRAVLPRVKRAHADARVVLCGRAPSPAVRALAGPDVTVTDTVPDTAPFLARAGAYVNLLRAGAGSSLKVPEAMAAGVPLVTTALGARGFALRDGVHARVVETAEDAAAAVCEAWRDPDAADARAREARALAEALDWDVVGARFAAVVLRAAGLA
jgi:glycosyltransferase involved in cell wall biosynthesis